MTFIEKEIILEKLFILKGYCAELEAISAHLSEDEYKKKSFIKELLSERFN
ncbi:hypothetical protein FTV88_2244 [Heliorestis convoluta]|uniref:Uncharacterized protein n=1 Tax=Heliorestis convoluta TaxID=356322 RepID=A0A5Q2N4V7_9FIRM|nr:hypothetical protein FTV88_2244 [Heliorestis convoluta]